MKKVFRKLAAGVAIVLGGLLSIGANAAEVLFGDPADPFKATEIRDLNVGGTNYDVVFDFAFAFEIYGAYPGSFPIFNDAGSAGEARDEVNDALQVNGALVVGEPTNEDSDGLPIFNIGYDSTILLGQQFVNVTRGIEETGEWNTLGNNTWLYNLDEKMYAVFTVADGGGGEPPETTSIFSSSLPSSRSIETGGLATAFGTIVNAGDAVAENCGISPKTSIPSTFGYQTTNLSGVVVGDPNTAVDIPVGQFQNFIFGFAPTAPFDPTLVELTFDCTNTDPAPVTSGLNTLLLSSSAVPVPDIVALSATPSNDGTLFIPASNVNAFAVAAINNGTRADITTRVDVGSLPLVVTVCETNPTTGACTNPTIPGDTSTTELDVFESATFSFFATAIGNIPFDPANSRIVVEFIDTNSVVRGSTSVAVTTD